eukprot:1433149-Alexandrium_andersonii.AAC.1
MMRDAPRGVRAGEVGDDGRAIAGDDSAAAGARGGEQQIDREANGGELGLRSFDAIFDMLTCRPDPVPTTTFDRP